MRYHTLNAVAVVLALLASALGSLHSWQAGLGTIASALLLLAGVRWGMNFLEQHERGAERAWTIWLLLPSIGAIAATFLAREVWELWAVLSLTVVTLPTIAGHALFMGQRDKVHRTAPAQALLPFVRWAPLLTALGVLLVLTAAGLVSVV